MQASPKSKASVELQTKIVALVYIGVVIIGLTFLSVKGMLNKGLIEGTGLNMLGDFTAGVFAPLAFIGLAGAFFLQREQLLLAKSEVTANENRNRAQAIAEENAARLNHAAAQANYKLGLYDKRKLVFDRLVSVGHAYTGNFALEFVTELQKALFDARFVFPPDVYDWIGELMELSYRAGYLIRETDAFEEKIKSSSATYSDEEADRNDEHLAEINKVRQKVFDDLLAKPLWDRFEPYMGLPTQIEFERAKP